MKTSKQFPSVPAEESIFALLQEQKASLLLYTKEEAKPQCNACAHATYEYKVLLNAFNSGDLLPVTAVGSFLHLGQVAQNLVPPGFQFPRPTETESATVPEIQETLQSWMKQKHESDTTVQICDPECVQRSWLVQHELGEQTKSQGSYGSSVLGAMLGGSHGSPDPIGSMGEGLLGSLDKSHPPADLVRSDVAILFSPIGSQTIAGKKLYESGKWPDFCKAIDDCHACYNRITGGEMSLENFHRAVFEPVETSELQLVWMFVLQYALFQAVGVLPAVVLGHSNGEYAAAVASGRLSRDDAMRILIVRAEAISQAERGSMASVKAAVDDVTKAIQAFKCGQSKVVVAAINSPYDTVVSGPSVEVDQLCNALDLFTIDAPAELDFDLASVELHQDKHTIMCIQPGSAIDDWNNQHPSCQVCTGDRIMKVNGNYPDSDGQWRGPAKSLTIYRATVKSTKLAVSTAMHSSLVSCAMKAVRSEAEKCALDLRGRAPDKRCQMVSSLSGELVEELDAAYWSSQDDVKPIHFMKAIRRVKELGCSKFLELGSGRLLSLGKRCIESGQDFTWFAALNPDDEVGGFEQAMEILQGCSPCHAPTTCFTQFENESDCPPTMSTLQGIFQRYLKGVPLTEKNTLYCLGLDSVRVEQLHLALKNEGFQCEMLLGSRSGPLVAETGDEVMIES